MAGLSEQAAGRWWLSAPLLVRPPRDAEEGRMAYTLRLAGENMLSFDMVLDMWSEAPSATFGDSSYLLPARAARVCPLCLRQTGLGRVGCELRFADACTVHGCWLVDLCSACGHRLTWKRSDLLQCQCGHSLSSEHVAPAPPALVKLSQCLEAAALELRDYPLATLERLDSEACFRLVHFLGAYASRPATSKPQKIAQVDALAVSWSISSLAAEILDQWPEGFVSLIDQLRTASHATGSLPRVFRGFYFALYSSFQEAKFDFVRKVFEDYVAAHWAGALGARNRRLSSEVLERAAWIPEVHAARLLGISRKYLRKLFSEHQFEIQERVTHAGRTFRVVRRSDAEHLRATFVKAGTLDKTASQLGLTSARLAGLIPLLLGSQAIPSRPGVPWAVASKWVQGWESFIDSLPVIPCRNHTALEDILRFRAWSNERIAALLIAMRRGELRVVGRSPKFGLPGVLLCSKGLNEWEQKYRDSPRPGLSVREAAHQLRIKEEVAYFLVKQGFLSADPLQGARRKEQRVSTKGMSDFCERYVLGRDIARGIRRSPRATAELLRNAGINPCSGPGVDRGRQLLYRRDERLTALAKAGIAGVQPHLPAPRLWNGER